MRIFIMKPFTVVHSLAQMSQTLLVYVDKYGQMSFLKPPMTHLGASSNGTQQVHCFNHKNTEYTKSLSPF